jgi:hypothetical protein
MWIEDRVARAPAPFRPAPRSPLACFAPLTPLADRAPGPTGRFTVPAPHGGAFEGDRLVVDAWPAHGARRGTAILVPPWKLRGRGVLSPLVRVVRRAGLEAWLLTPPHHLERSAPGARSGEAFVSPDLAATRRAIEQLVVELRALAALARTRGPVGVLGLSLGAHAAALAATAEPLDFAALLAPPADLGEVLAATAIGRRYRRLAARAGAPLPPAEELRAQLAPLDPSARTPTARRLLIAVGAHDGIARAAGALRLARAWGVPPLVYPRGHLTLLFACRALRRDLAAFLAAPLAGGPGPPDADPPAPA